MNSPITPTEAFEKIKKMLLEACGKYDVVFTTGGVSVGERDFVADIMLRRENSLEIMKSFEYIFFVKRRMYISSVEINMNKKRKS